MKLDEQIEEITDAIYLYGKDGGDKTLADYNKKLSTLIQKEREEDRKVLNISLGNIRARLNGLRKESIDTDNALTIGKIVDLISEVDYKVTEMETYLSQTKGGKE